MGQGREPGRGVGIRPPPEARRRLPRAALLLLGLAVGGRAGIDPGVPDGTLLESRPAPLGRGAPPGVVAERIRYAVDGLGVVGYLVTPPRPAGTALPLLLFNRGGIGPHGNLDRGDLGVMARLAAAGPYLVAGTQYRGNGGGEGRDQAGGADVHDVLALAKLAGSRPGVDPARTYMVGQSRGGTQAWLAVREGLAVRAFATVGAPVDGPRTYREIGPFMRRALARAVGGSPGRRPAEYARRSPVLWGPGLGVPVLILHGDRDRVIGVGQSRDLAARLAAAGAPHELAVIPGGNHRLSNRATERDRRILDFFARY